MWQSLHHFESSSTEEWTRAHHTREGENSERGEFGGESEAAVEATPEGEEMSEYGEGRYNAFENAEAYSDSLEPEGSPRSLVARTRRGRNPAT